MGLFVSTSAAAQEVQPPPPIAPPPPMNPSAPGAPGGNPEQAQETVEGFQSLEQAFGVVEPLGAEDDGALAIRGPKPSRPELHLAR